MDKCIITLHVIIRHCGIRKFLRDFKRKKIRRKIAAAIRSEAD